MSRSYKKHPWHKDIGCKKIDKRNANKTVRNKKDVPKGGAFKKCFESWNISDYCYYDSGKPYWSDVMQKLILPDKPWKAKRK